MVTTSMNSKESLSRWLLEHLNHRPALSQCWWYRLTPALTLSSVPCSLQVCTMVDQQSVGTKLKDCRQIDVRLPEIIGHKQRASGSQQSRVTSWLGPWRTLIHELSECWSGHCAILMEDTESQCLYVPCALTLYWNLMTTELQRRVDSESNYKYLLYILTWHLQCHSLKQIPSFSASTAPVWSWNYACRRTRQFVLKARGLLTVLSLFHLS